MKDMNKILTITLLGATCLTSCGDWLDLEPENSVTAEKYWQSEADVSAAMTGIYCSWQSNAGFMWEQSEMRDDMIERGNSDRKGLTLVREGNITSSNPLTTWEKYYAVINQCNLLLDRSHLALENDPSYSETQDEIYKAQARVVRALMYFYLIRLWKDVPYIDQAYYDDTKSWNVAPSDRMTILATLIDDMEEVLAEGYLPYYYSSKSSDKALNKGQVNKYMLMALLADMYRMQGSYLTDPEASQAAYKRCLTLCNNIIQSGQFALLPFTKMAADEANLPADELVTKADSAFYVLTNQMPEEWFNTLYVDGNSNECIMELQQDKDSYNAAGYFDLFLSPRYYAPNTTNLQNVLFLPTEKEVAMSYRYTDVRQYFCNAVLNGSPCVPKYAGISLNMASLNVSDYKKNVIVYRLAEIYLMKAEVLTQIAMANNNDQDMLLEAYRCVFKLRDRASAVETTDLQLSSGEYMQDRYWNELRHELPIQLNANDIQASYMEKFILDEEARELAFEGRRWFDVLRHAERNQEGNGNCTGGSLSYLLDISGSCTFTDKVSYFMGQFRKPDFRYLPYPYKDVQLNDLLSQKPFWGVE